MSINHYMTNNDKSLVIDIEGRFDFSLHQIFRDTYSSEKNIESFILDLSKAIYMDSSALGMILLLKDYAENLSAQVIISKPNDSVYKILEIAQFHRLLKIEH